jgi:hypothetical protein
MKTMQRFSSRMSLACFRGRGAWQRGLTTVVSAAFLAQAVSCAASDSGDAALSDRVVQTVLTGQYVDPESGELTSVTIAQDEFALGEYQWQERELMVDGARTLELDGIHTGTEIVVPLRGGGSMTLHRTGDVLEIVNVETNASYDSAKLPRVRVGQSFVEVVGAEDASVLVDVQGVEDLPDVERALATSLALDILLASVEDVDQVAPAVIIAAVAAVVGAAWLAACGVTLGTCVNRCGEEFEVRCGFLDVDVDFPHVSVGGSFSFSCKCR